LKDEKRDNIRRRIEIGMEKREERSLEKERDMAKAKSYFYQTIGERRESTRSRHGHSIQNPFVQK